MLFGLVVAIVALKKYVLVAVVTCTSVPFFWLAVAWRCVSLVAVSNRRRALIDDAMYSVYQRFVLFLVENVGGVQLLVYNTPACHSALPGEKAIYICNHQSSLDWAVFNMIAIRENRLGSLRYVLKDSLQYLPLYGWYFSSHGGVYVRRGRSFSSALTIQQLNYLRELDVPTSLVLFPEGTRFHPSKLATSKTYAQSVGVEAPLKTLLPRLNGMYLLVDNLKDTFDAVYDVTIAYECISPPVGFDRTSAPDILELICGSKLYKIHVGIDRIPMDVVPDRLDTLRLWLYDRFAMKDRALRRLEDNRPPFEGLPVVMEETKLFYTTIAAGVVSTLLCALMICLCYRHYRRGYSYEPAVAQLVANPDNGRPPKEFYV